MLSFLFYIYIFLKNFKNNNFLYLKYRNRIKIMG